jgi:hypothetical protein
MIFKKPFLLILSLFLVASTIEAQKITHADLKVLRQKEDSLKKLAKKLIVDSLTEQRMRNDSLFIRTLIRSLQVKNSFHYSFDSVIGISKLYAPDSAFRIFSWSLSFDDYYHRQRGAIQYKTADGSLKLIPLLDISEFTDKPTDSVRTSKNWIGAVYYNIIKTSHQGKNYYTLFGYDPNGVRSNVKWIDVLSFDAAGNPQFGGHFSFEKDSVKRKPQSRFFIEYKKEASAFVNYDPDLQVILVDHLISESDEPDKPYTFVPDGDNEAFKWENGKWVHIDKIFNEKIDMKGVDPYLGNPPVGDPLLDKEGNRDEKKLQEKSDKNKTKKKGDN